jgi:hypothetical protein
MSGQQLPAGHNPVIVAAHKTTHQIRMETFLDGQVCSATAVGPHALLTATHCEMPTEVIEIDGHEEEVQGYVRDGRDHTIFLVSATFTDWADFSTDPVQAGDDVFMFGNPGGHIDFFRKGVVVKPAPDTSGMSRLEQAFMGPDAIMSVYDFNSWFGDSGAAIFNTDGKIVGVVSIMGTLDEHEGIPEHQFMVGGFTLHFSQSVLDEAKIYAPKPAPTVP